MLSSLYSSVVNYIYPEKTEEKTETFIITGEETSMVTGEENVTERERKDRIISEGEQRYKIVLDRIERTRLEKIERKRIEQEKAKHVFFRISKDISIYIKNESKFHYVLTGEFSLSKCEQNSRNMKIHEPITRLIFDSYPTNDEILAIDVEYRKVEPIMNKRMLGRLMGQYMKRNYNQECRGYDEVAYEEKNVEFLWKQKLIRKFRCLITKYSSTKYPAFFMNYPPGTA